MLTSDGPMITIYKMLLPDGVNKDNDLTTKNPFTRWCRGSRSKSAVTPHATPVPHPFLVRNTPSKNPPSKNALPKYKIS